MITITHEQPCQPSRHCVIVGAGGAIGRALVDACLADRRYGAVFALSRDPAMPDHRVEASGPPRAQPNETSAPEARWIAADPTDPDSLAAAVAAVGAITPRVHRLIICTGLLHGGSADPGLRPEKSLGQLRLANLQRCIAVNAWAPLAALDAFAPLLRHAEGAVAAALSAMVGSIGDNRLGGWYSYRMSKAALNMGIRSAAIELGRRRHAPVVVAIHPGTTRSELSAPFAGPERARPARDSAAAILKVLDGLGPEHSGSFFNSDGRELPW